jgi:tetratricopeptide (TPR) repeat protein
MLVQSNFDCIFHSAPCVFTAAILLGCITRREWQAAPVSKAENPALLSSKNIPAYLQRGEAALKEAAATGYWLSAVANFSHAYLAGDFNARYRLLDALQISDDSEFQQAGFRLAMAINGEDRDKMNIIIRGIATQVLQAIGDDEAQHGFPQPMLKRRGPLFTRIRNASAALLAMLAIVVGAHLCRSLVHAWKPLYAVDQLSIEQRFLRLASVLDANPYLGLQRTMLEKFLLYLPSYMTAGFRQMVASHYYPTFKRLAIDREQDPQLALQLAAVAGWAGRMPEAIELMDRAIAIQAGHEDVYKALYLKGEYLKELAQSDAGIEPPEKVVALAQQALDCLEESKRRMPHTPQREIVTVRDLYIDECKQLIAAGTLPEPPASRDPGK